MDALTASIGAAGESLAAATSDSKATTGTRTRYGTVAANNGTTLDVTLSGGTLAALPMTADCLEASVGDRVAVSVDGPLATVTGVIATSGNSRVVHFERVEYAGGSGGTVTAPDVDGWEFAMWLSPATTGYIGSAYMTDLYSKTSQVWIYYGSPSAGTIRCTAVYMRPGAVDGNSTAGSIEDAIKRAIEAANNADSAATTATTATAAAEKVNATLDGTTLTVTSRDGSISTVDTKGERGEKGETGAQGAKGDKGDKGDTGATGATGAKGDKGDKGDTGAKGADGEVTLAYLKANCPVTYFLTGFGVAATPWHHLGTMSATYGSASATINVWSGSGYNGKATQNSSFQIMVKRGNKTGTTTDTAFGAAVTYGLNCAGCDVRVIATDASTCEIWVKLPWDYPAGRYDVEGYKVTWTDHGSDAPQADEPTGAVQSLASYTLMTTDNAELEYDRQVARGTYAGRSIQTILGCSSWADTYAALHAKVSAADFSGLRVGDYMDVTFTATDLITTATQRFVLAHFDPYYNTGATALTSHHLAFVAQKAVTVASGVTGYVNGGHIQWNTTATNNGTSAQPAPYIASNLHAFESKLAAELPSSISEYVISRTARLETRYSSSGTLADSNGSVIVAIGQLWSMSEVEYTGLCSWGTRGWSAATDRHLDLMRAAMPSTLNDGFWLRTPISGSGANALAIGTDNRTASFAADAIYLMPRPCFLFA